MTNSAKAGSIGVMKDPATVSTRAVAPILVGLKSIEADVARVLQGAELSLAEVSDPEGRVPHSQVVRMWEVAVEVTGDAAFGLRTAGLLPPGAFGVLEYAFRKSANLGEGFDRICRYFRLGHDVARMSRSEGGDQCVFEHTLPGARTLPRAAADFILSIPILILKDAAAEAVSPSEIWVDYAQPQDTQALQDRFECPIRYATGKRALVFSKADLDTPLRQAEPGLCGILDSHAEQLLSELPTIGSFSDRVRGLIAAELAGGDATAQDIARRLKMSVRTLHRRLTEEGTNHKQLLEELRRELAGNYLGDNAIEISEVAYLLGFSEPSAFHRAYRRWTGSTPAAFRKSLVSG